MYSFIEDHLRRNLSSCAASYYSFCLDASHVTWQGGEPAIAPPWSDGVRRARIHVEAQERGLAWPTWIVHRLDVIVRRFLLHAAKEVADDPERQKAALDFLLGEMSATAAAAHARLLIVYIPSYDLKPPPTALLQSVTHWNLEYLDLVPAFQRHRGLPLHIPHDGHPSVEGHSLIAEEIASAIRVRRLLETPVESPAVQGGARSRVERRGAGHP